MRCPCGTEKDFSNCCEPYIQGVSFPETAESLMRSRYTAYTQNNIHYIEESLAPESRSDFDRKATESWAKNSVWLGLQILSVKKGGLHDKTGSVEFVAKYSQDGEKIEHHEISQFRKTEKGRWYFVEGESHTHHGEGHHHSAPLTHVNSGPKLGRNDPCICGSQKKYKKCCGINA